MTNPSNFNFVRDLQVKVRLFCELLLLVWIMSFSPLSAAESVRKVDVSEVPELKGLGEHAREIGNALYPRILTLMSDDKTRLPQQIDIIFKKHIEMRKVGHAMGYVDGGNRIYLSADWFTKGLTNVEWVGQSPANLDLVLIHEMAHVAQKYNRRKVPSYWEEGMADYVRYKLDYTNGWSCPKCDVEYPHYTSGYWCAGAFLLYLDLKYGTNVVRQLNAELRRGSYTDQFFGKATGRSLDELWTEFQKTPAFTPRAAELNRYRDAIGYVNGRPPKDLLARTADYIQKQPGGALTMEAGQFLASLIQNNQAPGMLKVKGERGSLTVSVELTKDADSETYPVSRTFYCTKSGDLFRYHYTLLRASKESPWKLQRAWKTGPDGNVIEEYSVK